MLTPHRCMFGANGHMTVLMNKPVHFLCVFFLINLWGLVLRSGILTLLLKHYLLQVIHCSEGIATQVPHAWWLIGLISPTNEQSEQHVVKTAINHRRRIFNHFYGELPKNCSNPQSTIPPTPPTPLYISPADWQMHTHTHNSILGEGL